MWAGFIYDKEQVGGGGGCKNDNEFSIEKYETQDS
jgi:hypothetical protein